MENEKEKIFVSFTHDDIDWAEWIAEVLEKEGHTVIIQHWDFNPGDNFVLKMDEALRTCPIVIAVLSEAYLKSYHCQSELTTAYAKKNRKLIPVRVDDFEVEGLWATINYIDLVGKTEEEARKLLERISKTPDRKSKGFPGKTSGDTKPQNSLPDTNRKSTNPSGMLILDERIPAYARMTGVVGMPTNNLPPQNPDFIGRKKLLKEIHQALHAQNEVSLVQASAITGMGGIGKTETVIEYAYRHHKEYQHIWWVNAEAKTGFLAAYRSFAERESLSTPEDNSETIIAKVKTWMQEHNRWLFIFDNAENQKSLEKYCSSTGSEGQHILVTSRNPRFRNYAQININVFTESEACEFIKKLTGKTADSHFKELTKKMGYLPLALDQAGAYVNIHQMSYESYLSMYNSYNVALLAEYDDDPEKKTVATTWQISFEKIKKNLSAEILLNLCAFFAPDNIHTQWFQLVSATLPDELQALRDVVVNDLKYKDTIADLTRYSLVSQKGEGIIGIHRLVQEVIRHNLKQEQPKWRNFCVSILNKFRYFDFSTAESRALFIALVPHIDSVTQGISDEEATEEVARLYYFMGWGFYYLADYPQSLRYYGKALAIREKVLGKEHPDTATIYNNMALVYHAQGKYDLALEYYGKDLAISEKVLGKEHPGTAATYNNMALVYDAQGKYDLALEYYGKALAICEKVLGKEHLDTATTYNNVALVYRKQGKYNLALEYYGKALAISEKVLGKEHPDTATTYNNMALVYQKQGKYDLALEYYGKALAIREKVLGKEHPDTATTYHNIAGVYYAQDNYDLALEYCWKALAICKKVLGKEHPFTAMIYNNIALVYDAQGKYDLALEYYRKDLAISEKVLGKEHPDTATTYNNMALVYDAQSNYDLALEYFGKALAIYEKVLGKKHPDTARTYNNMALVYDAQGNYDLSLEYYLKALAICEKVLGSEHPDTKTTINSMTYTYEESGKPEPFKEWLRKKRKF